ncbi:MAG: hypothetical protein JWQ11_4510, partial [Rhizobacter sp.]|nr:hypothetical protein [Rhizobacter sp.]
FQPFNRLGREHGDIEGTGIGMVLSRHLAELLGGTLDVESELGAGTCVTLTLRGRVDASAASTAFTATIASAATAATSPDAATAVDVPETPSLAPIGPRADRPAVAKPGTWSDDAFAMRAAELDAGPEPCGCVVYIEDNLVNAILVERLLARWPQVEVLVAEDGASGLRLAAERQPQVLLLDMHLPDMHGLQVLAALRSGHETRHIPVVSLSANAMPEEVRAALAAGALAYWTKPIDFDQFIAGMRALLTDRDSGVADRSPADPWSTQSTLDLATESSDPP